MGLRHFLSVLQVNNRQVFIACSVFIQRLFGIFLGALGPWGLNDNFVQGWDMKKSKNAVARNLGLSICVAMGGVGAVPLILAASSAASFVQASEQVSEKPKMESKDVTGDVTLDQGLVKLMTDMAQIILQSLMAQDAYKEKTIEVEVMLKGTADGSQKAPEGLAFLVKDDKDGKLSKFYAFEEQEKDGATNLVAVEKPFSEYRKLKGLVDAVQDVAHTTIDKVAEVLDHVDVLDELAEVLDLEGAAHGITEYLGDVTENVIEAVLGDANEDEDDEGDETAGGGILTSTAGFIAGVIGNVLGTGSDTSDTSDEEDGKKTVEKKAETAKVDVSDSTSAEPVKEVSSVNEDDGEKSSEKNTDTVKVEVSDNTGTEQVDEDSSLKSTIQEGVGVVQEVTHTVIEKVGDVLENVPAVDDLAEGLDLKGLAHKITEDAGGIVEGVVDTALGKVTEGEENGGTTAGGGVLAGIVGVLNKVLSTGTEGDELPKEQEAAGNVTKEEKTPETTSGTTTASTDAVPSAPVTTSESPNTVQSDVSTDNNNAVVLDTSSSKSDTQKSAATTGEPTTTQTPEQVTNNASVTNTAQSNGEGGQTSTADAAKEQGTTGTTVTSTTTDDSSTRELPSTTTTGAGGEAPPAQAAANTKGTAATADTSATPHGNTGSAGRALDEAPTQVSGPADAGIKSVGTVGGGTKTETDGPLKSDGQQALGSLIAGSKIAEHLAGTTMKILGELAQKEEYKDKKFSLDLVATEEKDSKSRSAHALAIVVDGDEERKLSKYYLFKEELKDGVTHITLQEKAFSDYLAFKAKETIIELPISKGPTGDAPHDVTSDQLTETLPQGNTSSLVDASSKSGSGNDLMTSTTLVPDVGSATGSAVVGTGNGIDSGSGALEVVDTGSGGSSSGALSETKVENYRQAVAKLFKDGGELLGKAGTASKGLESLIQSSKAPLQVARLDVGGQVPENIRDYVVVIEKPDGNTLLQRLQRTEEGGLKLVSPTQARSLLDMSKAGAKGTLGGETVNALLTQADAAGWKVKAIYGLQPDATAEGGLSVVRYLPEEAFAKVEAALKAGKEVIAAIAEVEADAVKAAGDKAPAVEVAKVDGDKVPTVELAKVDGDKVPAVEVAKVDGDKVPAVELAKVDADSAADAAAAEPAAVAEEAEQALAMLEAAQVPGLNNPALRRQAYADALAYMGRAASRFDGQLLDELGQDHGLAAGDSRLWAGLIGASESIAGSGDREDSKERSQGVAAGVVFQLRDDLTLGVALGQTVGKVSSDGKAKLDLTQVAVAGLHRLNGQDSGPYLGGGLGAAHAGIQAKRSHEGETARGKTSATQFHASVKLGSDIDVGDWIFEPSLGLMGVQTHLKGTREKNEGLRIKSQVHNSAFAQTGLNLSRNFQLEGWMLKPELSAQYQYRLSNPESVKVAYDDTSWRQPGATDKRGGAGFGLGLEVRKSLMRAKAEVGDDGAVNLSLGVSW